MLAGRHRLLAAVSVGGRPRGRMDEVAPATLREQGLAPTKYPAMLAVLVGGRPRGRMPGVSRMGRHRPSALLK
jgi:hypothetical protein